MLNNPAKIDNGNLFARRFKHDFSLSMVIDVRGREKGREETEKEKRRYYVEKLYACIVPSMSG